MPIPPQVGAQDVHFAEKGAFTGSIAVGMVASLGCSYVLVGHSERRALFGDDDESINKKVCLLDALFWLAPGRRHCTQLGWVRWIEMRFLYALSQSMV